MGRVMVTSVGRSPGLNFCRSLRLANEDFFILGLDKNKYSLAWSEADKKILVPSVYNEEYLSIINYLIKKYDIEFIYPSKSDEELLFFSENREKISARLFLPDKEDVCLFEDKWETYKLVNKLELCKTPKTYLINDKDELYQKMRSLTKNFKEEIWLRRIYGSGGACSISTNDFELANAWINRFDGWGKFTLSEKLSDRSFTWSGIWKEGDLISSIMRDRLYWEFSDRAPSGVTGITGGQRLIANPEIDELSKYIVKSISNHPQGVICIDYTYDKDEIPNLTEIQASRLYTSSHFMTKCGINMPYILYKLAMDMQIEEKETILIPNYNKIWLKYVENYPTLIDESQLIEYEANMNKIIKVIKQGVDYE